MGNINVLDDRTINLIAAGEVVERPMSVVKELVENSMDSGATSITVEIKQGGIEFIRVTDNGSGILRDDVKTAFLRHATSKIKDADDLLRIASMGFRGEALSSIASVARVELVTKRAEDLMGTRYLIDGGKGLDLEEVGAPDGTTIIVRNLFFNTPARRKFLKSEIAEGNNIMDSMHHLALARPDISFKFINNGKVKFATTGKNDVKEIIYRLYGKETSDQLIPIDFEEDGKKVSGYLGKPSINRANRNFETYFVNNRYVKDRSISAGIEEGYRAYLMQHKFPFCVLFIDMDFSGVDVNVHPAKMEIRFENKNLMYDFICKAIDNTLNKREMIPSVSLEDKKEKKYEYNATPESFEINRIKAKEVEDKIESIKTTEHSIAGPEKIEVDTTINENESISVTNNVVTNQSNITDMVSDENSVSEAINVIDKNSVSEVINVIDKNKNYIDVSNNSFKSHHENLFSVSFDDNDQAEVKEYKSADNIVVDNTEDFFSEETISVSNDESNQKPVKTTKPEQLAFFEEDKFLSKNAVQKFKIIGQVFKTYWIIEYNDNVYFIDQHAAHEKVNYERIMKRVSNNEKYTQELFPPIVVSLSPNELTVFNENKEYFDKLGFETQEFGGLDISLTGIPMELYFNNPKDMFLSIIQELSYSKSRILPGMILDRIATMACKASVKGGDAISLQEMEALINELLTLDNPYNCPHGRPTIFSMSKYELEKKFKRIVD